MRMIRLQISANSMTITIKVRQTPMKVVKIYTTSSTLSINIKRDSESNVSLEIWNHLESNGIYSSLSWQYSIAFAFQLVYRFSHHLSRAIGIALSINLLTFAFGLILH